MVVVVVVVVQGLARKGGKYGTHVHGLNSSPMRLLHA